jgi:NAD(P)H-hydrate epimerase
MNSTGNPGMATAGAGDVLTGIIAALAGQGLPMAEAAYCGAFIHGLAGDLASDAYGQRSVMALDILNHIPKALKMVEK